MVNALNITPLDSVKVVIIVKIHTPLLDIHMDYPSLYYQMLNHYQNLYITYLQR